MGHEGGGGSLGRGGEGREGGGGSVGRDVGSGLGGPGTGTRSGDRGRGRDRDQRGGRQQRQQRQRRPDQAPSDQRLLDNGDKAPAPVDPPPQSKEQIESERVARQAEVRRIGRGQTILAAAARLGEGAGPLIHRRTLGGL